MRTEEGRWKGTLRVSHAKGWVRRRTKFWFVVIIAKLLELVEVAVVVSGIPLWFEKDSLISKLGSNKKKPRLEDTQARGYRDRVKIFDFERFHSFVFVFDGNLVKVSHLALYEKKESALAKVNEGIVCKRCD
jgi:hypothetical protein